MIIDLRVSVCVRWGMMTRKIRVSACVSWGTDDNRTPCFSLQTNTDRQMDVKRGNNSYNGIMHDSLHVQEHKTLPQGWVNVGPASQTVGHHLFSFGWTPVCCDWYMDVYLLYSPSGECCSTFSLILSRVSYPHLLSKSRFPPSSRRRAISRRKPRSSRACKT